MTILDLPPSEPALPLHTLPAPSLILVAGLPGAGKSTFCRQHFAASQIVCWDDYRVMLADRQEGEVGVRETDWLTLHVAHTRLSLGRLTVMDGSLLGVQRRAALRSVARRHECPCYLILIDTPVEEAIARGLGRADRPVTPASVRPCVAAVDAIRAETRDGLYAGSWRIVI